MSSSPVGICGVQNAITKQVLTSHNHYGNVPPHRHPAAQRETLMSTTATEPTATATAVPHATTPARTLPALEWSATLCDGRNVDQATAEASCAALGDGWRLPTAEELLSLVDRSRHSPAIDTTAFPDTRNDWCWTRTITAWSPVYAWVVNSYDGNAGVFHRDDNVACVRAVRSVASGQ